MPAGGGPSPGSQRCKLAAGRQGRARWPGHVAGLGVRTSSLPVPAGDSGSREFRYKLQAGGIDISPPKEPLCTTQPAPRESWALEEGPPSWSWAPGGGPSALRRCPDGPAEGTHSWRSDGAAPPKPGISRLRLEDQTRKSLIANSALLRRGPTGCSKLLVSSNERQRLSTGTIPKAQPGGRPTRLRQWPRTLARPSPNLPPPWQAPKTGLLGCSMVPHATPP